MRILGGGQTHAWYMGGLILKLPDKVSGTLTRAFTANKKIGRSWGFSIGLNNICELDRPKHLCIQVHFQCTNVHNNITPNKGP